MKYSTDTGAHPPIQDKIRLVNAKMKEILKKELDDMLALGTFFDLVGSLPDDKFTGFIGHCGAELGYNFIGFVFTLFGNCPSMKLANQSQNLFSTMTRIFLEILNNTASE